MTKLGLITFIKEDYSENNIKISHALWEQIHPCVIVQTANIPDKRYVI